MDQKYLAEIKAREQAATRGPWEVKTNRHPETTREAWGWIKGPCENWCWTDRRSSSRHDAEFIAHARTDIPALLAEVEGLNCELSRIRSNAADDKKMLQKYNAAKDQQIAKLRKALLLMGNDLADWMGNGTGEFWARDYTQQAQEQEGK
jgi:hypothetical protein